MDKSKRIYAIVAICVVVICLFAFLSSGNGEDPTPTDESTITPTNTAPEPTDPGPGTQTTIPSTGNTQPTEEQGWAGLFPQFDITDIVQVNDSVKIQKVDMDPDAVIDRTQRVDENHPEYIPYNDAKACISTEGKVYRNDSLISINVTDRFTGDVYTFTFGYPTGEYNRFLYLNPQCDINGVSSVILGKFIHFNFVNGSDGSIAHFSDDLEGYNNQYVNFHMGRHLSEENVATYKSTLYPGSVWFTMPPLNEPAEIHCRVFNEFGYHMATLAIIIEKDDQGTYGFTDIRIMDLWDDNSEYPEYTHDELTYISSVIEEAISNNEFIYLSVDFEKVDITVDRCTYDMRTSEEGYYYPRFFNIDPNWSDLCKDIYSENPLTVAVTIKRFERQESITVYLWVLANPSETSHGHYSIVGADYKDFYSADDVKNPRLDILG